MFSAIIPWAVLFFYPLWWLTFIQDLCHAALQFSFNVLKTGGHFICKFYQGAEDKELEEHLRKLFRKVHRLKPESSRDVCAFTEEVSFESIITDHSFCVQESKEAYFIGLERKS